MKRPYLNSDERLLIKIGTTKGGFLLTHLEIKKALRYLEHSKIGVFINRLNGYFSKAFKSTLKQ